MTLLNLKTFYYSCHQLCPTWHLSNQLRAFSLKSMVFTIWKLYSAVSFKFGFSFLFFLQRMVHTLLPKWPIISRHFSQCCGQWFLPSPLKYFPSDSTAFSSCIYWCVFHKENSCEFPVRLEQGQLQHHNFGIGTFRGFCSAFRSPRLNGAICFVRPPFCHWLRLTGWVRLNDNLIHLGTHNVFVCFSSFDLFSQV